jgi:hypothetical protein
MIRILVVVGLFLLSAGTPAIRAIELGTREGAARGFPAMRTLEGKPLRNGDFVQWIERGRLHIRIVYRSSGGRIEEYTVVRQQPQLIQDTWSWREFQEGRLDREFTIDFRSGRATARKHDGGKLEEWSESLDVEPGRTYAGFAFSLAIKGLRKDLVAGQSVELRAVGFTPKPRTVNVAISFAGVERMAMAGRVMTGDHFVIHPQVPWFAKPFVKVPDTHLWLTSPPAVGFLRWEGPLAEPDDPLVRVDVLPGGRSESATPVNTATVRLPERQRAP